MEIQLVGFFSGFIMVLCKVTVRALVLFSVGTFFSIVLNLLQKQRGIPNLPEALAFFNDYLANDWWVHPVVGVAAGLFITLNKSYMFDCDRDIINPIKIII